MPDPERLVTYMWKGNIVTIKTVNKDGMYKTTVSSDVPLEGIDTYFEDKSFLATLIFHGETMSRLEKLGYKKIGLSAPTS
jgi:hypothetical protein